MYSIPIFGLLLKAVASDDDIISGKRDGWPSFIKEEIKRGLWSILTLYMDKLHRFWQALVVIGSLENTCLHVFKEAA